MGQQYANSRQAMPHTAVIAAALTVAAALGGCKGEVESQAPIRTVKAIRLADDTGVVEVDLPGRASAEQEVEMSFRVTGRLAEFPMKVGQRVTQGQMLAQLDRRDFQNTVHDITGQLARAEADVEVARSDFERAVNIRDENPGAISRAVIDQRRGELKQTQATVVSVQARLEDAKNDLSDTTLIAPFDGVIAATYVNNYEEVNAKQPVLRLVDTSNIEIEVQVPEQHISKVPHVKSIFCRFDAFPDTQIPVTIHEIGSEAAPDTRTYPVTLIMSQPEDVLILPGMAATVTIAVDAQATREAGHLTVPATAVFADESDQPYVWLVDPTTKRVKRQAVEIRMPVPGGLSVDGLEPGMWVVTAGVHFLTENQQVILPDTRGGE